jgi:4-hydroxybenzoyl-CoA thioesterase
MIYSRIIPVEFNHCDPAGIVFYPRYFEMTNSVVENFFAEAVGHSFARMMEGGQGVPTARIEVTFRVPSRLGDRLEWSLQVMRVGGSSVTLLLTAAVGGAVRLTADLTLVWVEQGRPGPWPDAIRAKLNTYLGSAK